MLCCCQDWARDTLEWGRGVWVAIFQWDQDTMSLLWLLVCQAKEDEEVGFGISRRIKLLQAGSNYLLPKSFYNAMSLLKIRKIWWTWQIHIESPIKAVSDLSEKVWKWITLSDSVDVTRRISAFGHQWVVIRWGLAEPLIEAASQTRELHSVDNIFWLLSTPPLGSEETKKSGSLRPTLTNDPQPLSLSPRKKNKYQA